MKKTTKQEKPVLLPIEIVGKLREEFIEFFPEKFKKYNVFLWTQLSDPNWWKNSSPNPINYILTTCKGMFDVKKAMAEETNVLMEGITSSDDNLGDEEETLTINFSEIPATEVIGPQSIQELMKKFKKDHCKHQKIGCSHRHYLISIGTHAMDDKYFGGIHIFLEPKESDPVVHQCHEDQRSGKTDKVNYVCSYIKEFRLLLQTLSS